MLTKLKTWFRDWRRGYTDADAFSMLNKISEDHAGPGQTIPLTAKEMKALTDYSDKKIHFNPFY